MDISALLSSGCYRTKISVWAWENRLGAVIIRSVEFKIPFYPRDVMINIERIRCWTLYQADCCELG